MKKTVYVRTTGIYDDSRATKEIKSLSELGYRVVVLAWDRKGDANAKCQKVFEQFLNLIEIRFFQCKYQMESELRMLTTNCLDQIGSKSVEFIG